MDYFYWWLGVAVAVFAGQYLIDNVFAGVSSSASSIKEKIKCAVLWPWGIIKFIAGLIK